MRESEVVSAVLALGILELDLRGLILIALDLLDPANIRHSAQTVRGQSHERVRAWMNAWCHAMCCGILWHLLCSPASNAL